jgi:hypothetical protein
MARETTRLDLLADINATVDALAMRAHVFREAASAFSVVESGVSASPVESGDYIDPDFQIISAFEDAESILKAYLPRMMAKRASIDRDGHLTPEHRDALHDAHDEVMTYAALLHEGIQAARAAIIGHDLAAEPRDTLPVLNTVEALIADLRHT